MLLERLHTCKYLYYFFISSQKINKVGYKTIEYLCVEQDLSDAGDDEAELQLLLPDWLELELERDLDTLEPELEPLDPDLKQ